MTNPTTVFISYSHDSPEHANQILELSNRLRTDGVDCTIDQYEVSPAEGWPKWMDRQIADSDFVLVVCTEVYYRRVTGKEEIGKGLGVKWESTITYQDVYNKDSTNSKFIPVLFGDGKTEFIPKPLKSATYYFLFDQYEELYRRITNQPKVIKPELGSIRKMETAKVLAAVPALERKTDFFASDWHLAHPYPMPPNFTGRATELKMLDDWLANDQDRLFILRALGGFGKSALAWQWINTHVNPAQWTKLVWWSFYEGDASFEHFIEETLKYLKLEVPQGQRPQVDELLKAMQSQKTLLIMDGFERALRLYANMNAAYQSEEEQKIEDSQLDCVNINAEFFLKGVCSLPSIKSKVLITTRLTPRTIKPRGEFMLGSHEEELTAIQPADGVEFFHKQKIRGTHAEIEAACAPYGYHPLSLRILAGLITNDREKPGDIAVADSLDITDDIIQNKNHVLKVAYDTLSAGQQKLLSNMACFRSSISYQALKVITSKPSWKRKNKTLLNEKLDDSLKALEFRGLIDWDRHANKYDLHPIVRSYAYEQLTTTECVTAHRRLRDYFATLNAPKQPKTFADLTPVIELYHHILRAGELDEAFRLFEKRLGQSLYFQFGSYQTFIELLNALFVDDEKRLPRLNDEENITWVLNNIANAYSLNGQPYRAKQVFDLVIHMDEKTNSKSGNAVTTLGNMAYMAQMPLGELRAAELNLQRSIEICRETETENEMWEAVSRQELAHLLSYRGEWADAQYHLALATKTWENDKDAQGISMDEVYRALRSVLMSRDLEQSSTQNGKTAIMHALRSLEFSNTQAKSVPVERDFVRAHWLLGEGYRIDSQFDLAEHHLSEEALRRCRAINLVENEANILLDIARLRYDQKNYEEAKSLAAEALLLTERCGYVLQGADVNLFLAQYVLEQEKDKVKAKEYAETALKLATCDGPPYYYKVAYEEAERFLEKLK